jgi:acyl-CoA reductase-like NAD-dependent aldehyde dehydrogenase
VWGYIVAGKQEGAKCIVGGEKRSGKGYFVDPTIFTDIRPDMKIVCVTLRFVSVFALTDYVTLPHGYRIGQVKEEVCNSAKPH